MRVQDYCMWCFTPCVMTDHGPLCQQHYAEHLRSCSGEFDPNHGADHEGDA